MCTNFMMVSLSWNVCSNSTGTESLPATRIYIKTTKFLRSYQHSLIYTFLSMVTPSIQVSVLILFTLLISPLHATCLPTLRPDLITSLPHFLQAPVTFSLALRSQTPTLYVTYVLQWTCQTLTGLQRTLLFCPRINYFFIYLYLQLLNSR